MVSASTSGQKAGASTTWRCTSPGAIVTTASDERGRKTVMELVSGLSRAGLFPVGRLDKDSEGLLLLTNDGAFAQAGDAPLGRGVQAVPGHGAAPRGGERRWWP